MLRTDNGGARHNEGKSRVDLIPPDVLLALGRVYEYGSRKYADRNWERGMPWSTCYGCLIRHLLKWWAGEEFDIESGLPHIDMVAWNAIALSAYEKRRIGTDDRNILIEGD